MENETGMIETDKATAAPVPDPVPIETVAEWFRMTRKGVMFLAFHGAFAVNRNGLKILSVPLDELFAFVNASRSNDPLRRGHFFVSVAKRTADAAAIGRVDFPLCELLAMQEAGEYLRCTPFTVKKICRLGGFPSYKLGRQLLYALRELNAYIETRRCDGEYFPYGYRSPNVPVTRWRKTQ